MNAASTDKKRAENDVVHEDLWPAFQIPTGCPFEEGVWDKTLMMGQVTSHLSCVLESAKTSEHFASAYFNRQQLTALQQLQPAERGREGEAHHSYCCSFDLLFRHLKHNTASSESAPSETEGTCCTTAPTYTHALTRPMFTVSPQIITP